MRDVSVCHIARSLKDKQGHKVLSTMNLSYYKEPEQKVVLTHEQVIYCSRTSDL